MHAATRILILHSHVLLRKGLVELLRRYDELHVVGEAAGLDEALAAARSARPHVAIVEGADAASLEACHALSQAHPRLPLVMLGASRDLAFIARAFRSGATTYVPADVGLEELVACLGEAHRKGREAGPHLARPRSMPPPPPPISLREREVLALVARGQANKQIGRALSISENTVRNHIANIFGKLGVKDRTEAAIQAMKRGLV